MRTKKQPKEPKQPKQRAVKLNPMQRDLLFGVVDEYIMNKDVTTEEEDLRAGAMRLIKNTAARMCGKQMTDVDALAFLITFVDSRPPSIRMAYKVILGKDFLEEKRIK